MSDFRTSSLSLASPAFNVSGVSCFTFDYYFLADSTKRNELEIVLSDQHQSSETLIWDTSGLNVDDWGKGEAQIDQPGTYKVSI